MYKNMIAVTNRHLVTHDFLKQLEILADSDYKAIILREKDLSADEYEELAKSAIEICRLRNKTLILHNFYEVALELQHRKLHLPFGVLEKNREIVKEIEVLGTSIHSVEEAVLAEKLGADYVTAGHIYSTDCKRGLKPRGLGFLADVCAAVNIPVYAIGGINPDRMPEVMGVGAAGGCVMSHAMRME